MTTSAPRAPISAFSHSHGFLSNFWIQQIAVQVHGRDVVAPSAEHAFQAIKADRWEDAERILASESPVHALQIGASVTAREDWDTIRIAAMDHVLRAKFSVGSVLGQRLLEHRRRHFPVWQPDERNVLGRCARPGQWVARLQLAGLSADAAALRTALGSRGTHDEPTWPPRFPRPRDDGFGA